MPELRSAREYADTWEDGLNVRLLGITDLLLRAHVMAMYPDPSDRRRIILEATEKRVAKFAPYFARRQSLTRLFSRYSDDEMAVILDFLTRSTERLREDVAQLES